ncbi:MAG: DNA-directed RNA polymerase subunit RPC12/RpoP [Myxococcota bacterium]|jgi:DNA-directed RNA polymerase subunit RPC12/RpoP
MSYFDHVRCPSCRSMLDPEKIGGRMGFACPYCGGQLSAKDLFGVAAAFSEEDQPDLTLDDLMKPDGGVGAPQDFGGMPHATQQALQREAQQRGGNAMVRRGTDDDDDDDAGGGGSAMDLMRKMKRR